MTENFLNNDTESVLIVESRPGLATEIMPETLRRLNQEPNRGVIETAPEIQAVQEESIIAFIRTERDKHRTGAVIVVLDGLTDAANMIWRRALTTIAVQDNYPVYRFVERQPQHVPIVPLPTQRHYVESLEHGGSREVFEKYATPEPQKTVTSLLTAAFWFIGASMVGVIASLIHVIEVDFFGISRAPIGVLFASAIIACVMFASRGLSQHKFVPLAAMFGIAFSVILLAMYTINGTLIIQATFAGYAWLGIGVFLPVMVAMWPKRERYYPHVVIT